jgi:tetratricopeptide (TPR) repeat protein
MIFIRTILLTLLLVPTVYANDAVLIREMETLRNSLPEKDPGRPILTRRLADVCFQKAVQDDKDLIASGKGSAAEVDALRAKAVGYYTESLAFATPELKFKIDYQLARLMRMKGENMKALAAFGKLTATTGITREILRESMLSIAEIYDEEGQWVKAQEAYIKALPYAQDADGISYIRFRLAWAYFRKDQLSLAQTEMANALYDSQKNLKEQAMLDYIQFLAATPQDNGAEAMKKIDAIATQEKRLEFLENLGEAYFSAGNNAAGVFVMSQIQQQRPDSMRAARLSEEFYGFKRFDDMKAMLAYLQTQTTNINKLEAKQRDFIDQVLRRLVVQLDGQRKSNPGLFGPELVQAVDTHMALFPQSDVVEKMRSGWLAANTSDDAKIQRLALWIKTQKDPDLVRSYRQERAALGAKLKNNVVIREEAGALALSSNEAEAREWSYVEGKAALDMGEDTYALGVFQKLALKTESPDKWAVQSQHLSLDILNKQKRYQDLATQAALWTSVAALQNSAFKADLAEMKSAGLEASFEHAASLGETPAALVEFNRFCQNGEFAEKSCTNAKVLAIKLNDQATLVQVLERQGDQTALAVEYERMGRFAEAAKILEPRMTLQDPEVEWIKISVLYQIGSDETSRARVLRKLSARLKAQNKMSPELAGTVRAAYQGSEIKTAELLGLPWSAADKINLAADLETAGLGDAQTKKLVLASKEDLGSLWAKGVFERAKAADQKHRRVSFYKGDTRYLYQLRLRLLGKYAEEVKTILPGASAPVRIVLLNDLARAYSDLDQEILATPMPAGMTEEQLAGAKEAMESLASPLRAEGESYAKLSSEQLSGFAEAAQWQEALSVGADAVVAQMQTTESSRRTNVASGMTAEERKNILAELARTPDSRNALEKLKNDFTTRGNEAAAAYFSGRLAALEQL